MVGCKVNIIEAFELDRYPGWCKAILKDCNGVEHILIDKLSVTLSINESEDVVEKVLKKIDAYLVK